MKKMSENYIILLRDYLQLFKLFKMLLRFKGKHIERRIVVIFIRFRKTFSEGILKNKGDFYEY